jgi:large subunit ribosomal protein L17
MRHSKKINHLGRKAEHRKAMLSNMAISLIEHKRIKTTVAKAKALKIFVEPLINRSKEDTTHSRRMVFKHLQSKGAVTELFKDVSQKIAERNGGYTRILRTGNRFGDNAEMCIIELVDYNQSYTQGSTGKDVKKKTRRGKAKVKETTAELKKPAAKKQSKPVDEKKIEEHKKIEEVKDVETHNEETNPSEEIQ